MTNQHPITPPADLIARLHSHWFNTGEDFDVMLTQAFQAGADTELEACCEWLKAKHWVEPEFSEELRAARRPKPPSLKEQAMSGLAALDDRLKEAGLPADLTVLRHALEQLDD